MQVAWISFVETVLSFQMKHEHALKSMEFSDFMELHLVGNFLLIVAIVLMQ